MVVTPEDVAGWPYSVSVSVEWVAFLGTLHCPVGNADLGVGGVSFVELLVLYEFWAWIALATLQPMRRLTGRGRVYFLVIDARRNFAGVCGRWYPVNLVLHRFFVAISRAVVNHVDGVGTALDPLVWSAGTLPKRRRLVHAVRDHALLPGAAGVWVTLVASSITADDVRIWPYSVGILVKWVAFLSSLHWPAARADLGVGGVSFVEMLILYELWAGERMVLSSFSVGCSAWSRH